jgi:hypothetical protein
MRPTLPVTGPALSLWSSRIGRAITVMVSGRRTFDFDRATAADPNCHLKKGR